MSDRPLRFRGLKVRVDTTEVAEWDISGFSVTDEMLDRISNRLAAETHSGEDRVVGDVRVRLLEGMDVIFSLSREHALIVATICGMRPPDPEKPTEQIIYAMQQGGSLRSFLGI